ncbi:MAG: hypothetical protein WDN48_16150 [Pseudolabrys sp.]
MNQLTLDTDTRVFFYEQDHYYLSNFSAFKLRWMHHDFDTSEQAYQWSKFHGEESHHPEIQRLIQYARSAHEAFKIAEDSQPLTTHRLGPREVQRHGQHSPRQDGPARIRAAQVTGDRRPGVDRE